MKISLAITAIIIAIASAFGLHQRSTIKTLTSEWLELKETASSRKISTDPDAAFDSKRVANNARRSTRENAVKDFASDLVEFALRMKAAQRADDGSSKELEKEAFEFIDILTNLNPADYETLINALQKNTEIGPEEKREMVMMSIMMIASDHPESALSIITAMGDKLGNDHRTDFILPMVISQFATKDPAGAAGWVLANEKTLGEKKAEQMKSTILSVTAQKDITSALAMVDTLGFKDPATLITGFGHGIRPGEQTTFIKALESKKLDSDQRKEAIKGIGSSPLIKDFTAATEWLSSPELKQEDRDTIIDSLDYQSVNESPGKWLNWIADQETGSTNATTQILEGWTRADYLSAGKWLQNREPGPTKDTAVESYADTLAPYEPAAAAQWAETLPAGENRTELLQTIYSSLKDKDPAAAQALAEKHQLSE